MPPIVSELVKLTVKPGFTPAAPEFAQLRQAAAAYGAKEQYYGTCTDAPDTLFWIIQWPASGGPLQAPDFRKAVAALDAQGDPASCYLPFAHESLPRPALTAPVCQLCFLHVNRTADRGALAQSLNKTFTDCYFADGFMGGHWSTGSNDDRLNYYYLGWKSREFHDEFAKTELFAEELDKLMPHIDSFGTNYIKMTQQLN
ncbi:hypothetical protein FB451DRAFT_1377795 [Mycena latifolia]|nr:hypothetical protein FB451DRAFT_1377795 [Mycena latifolia]